MHPDITITAAAVMYAAHASGNYTRSVKKAEDKKTVKPPVAWGNLDKENQEFWLSISKHLAKIIQPEKRGLSGMAETIFSRFGKGVSSFDPVLCVQLFLNVRSSFHSTVP